MTIAVVVVVILLIIEAKFDYRRNSINVILCLMFYLTTQPYKTNAAPLLTSLQYFIIDNDVNIMYIWLLPAQLVID